MASQRDASAIRYVGRYRLLRRLAVGGMAEVFVAERAGPSGGSPLALKCILPQHAAVGEFVDMFLAEARIAGMLRHENIVRTYEFGMVDGEYFIVMELLAGLTVRKLSDGYTRRGTHLPRPAAVAIVRAIAAGLNYAHERCDAEGAPLGIVHRDVSPQNVIVTRHGGVKLLDFGIAKSSARIDATREGALKGKLRYMSPEQCRGVADRRSDVFACGLILYELTLGRSAYRGKSDEELFACALEARYEPPRSIDPSYPAELEAVIACALQPAPEDRHPSGAALAADLAIAARSLGPPATAAVLAELVADEQASVSAVEAMIAAEQSGRARAATIELEDGTHTDLDSIELLA